METKRVFEDLAAELTDEERKRLREKILSSIKDFSAPLLVQATYGTAAGEGQAQESRSSLRHFWLVLRSIMLGKSLEEIRASDTLKVIGKRIEWRYPGLVNFRRHALHPLLAQELTILRDAAFYFAGVLEKSVEGHRAEFHAFLGSLEMPEIHQQLAQETDPFAALDASVREHDARTLLLKNFEKIIGRITEASRKKMYGDLRSLLFLKRLSTFPFARLLERFGTEGAAHNIVPAAEARDSLANLGDILFSMSYAPSIELMESLFAFLARESEQKPNADFENIISAGISKAEEALDSIRSFNERIPLGDLLRFVMQSPDYEPRELTGAEDWFAIYKSFWKDRIDRQLSGWKTEHRYLENKTNVELIVGPIDQVQFENISRKEEPGKCPINLEYALRFFVAFVEGPYRRACEPVLTKLLAQGEFYRKENRIELSKAAETIAACVGEIVALNQKLSQQGEYGAAWLQSQMGNSNLLGRQRSQESLAKTANLEAEKIVLKGFASIRSIVLVVQGVIAQSGGSEYDSISNILTLDSKVGETFVSKLKAIRQTCENARDILFNLSGLDPGA